MTGITLRCRGASAAAAVEGTLTAGAVGIPVRTEFDSAWDGLTRKFIFRAGEEAVEAVPVGGSLTVPRETLQPGQRLLIGAVGTDAQGSIVIPTAWASCGTVQPSPLSMQTVQAQEPPTPGLVEQILAKAQSAEEKAELALAAAGGGSSGGAGAPGKSAYQLAVEQGFSGTQEQWLEGLRGEPGGFYQPQAVQTGGNNLRLSWSGSQDTLPAVSPVDVTLPGLTFGPSVWFGDSMAAGEGSGGRSYVDIAAESGLFASVTKAARSGACIGPYSLPDAAGYNGTQQAEAFSAEVARAEQVFLQYGGNDLAAVIAGRVALGTGADSKSAATVCGYLRRLIERIYELNAAAQITFLDEGASEDYLKLSAGQLATAWGIDEPAAERLLLSWNREIMAVLEDYGIRAIPIYDFSNRNGLTMQAYLSGDGIHPNEFAHRMLFRRIVSSLYTAPGSGKNDGTRGALLADFTADLQAMTFTSDIPFRELSAAWQRGNAVGARVDSAILWPVYADTGVITFGGVTWNSQAGGLVNALFNLAANDAGTVQITQLVTSNADLLGTGVIA